MGYDGDDKFGPFKDSDGEFWRRFGSALKDCDDEFEKRFGSSEDGYRFGRWSRDSDKDRKYGRRYGASSKNFKDGYRYRSGLKSRQYKLSDNDKIDSYTS